MSRQRTKQVQEIVIDLPKPHSKRQQLIMQALLMPEITDITVTCGTKMGKSLAASCAIISGAINKPGTKWRWVAPIYEQAKIGMEDYFPKILPPYPYTEFKPGNMSIAIPSIGSSFEFWHAKNPMALEGKAINGYVIDEAAKCPEQIYFSARTTTTVTKGPIMAISTPLGKNWFYKHSMNCKDAMEWAISKGKTPDKIFIQAPTACNPFVPRESIERARQELPERLFRQYYLAEFLDEGSVFIGTRDCLYGPELNLKQQATQIWIHPESKSMDVCVGVDWAKTVDYTVFIAIEPSTRRVVAFKRFNKLNYTTAVKELIKFCKNFKDVDIILHDKTGVGSALDDYLSLSELPYRGVTFTNNSKAEMIMKLITAVEQQRIHLPRWPEMISEFDAYESSVTPSGNVVYGAPSGKHDDIVSAMMLANNALLEYGDASHDVIFIDDPETYAEKKTTAESIEDFYTSFLNEDDEGEESYQ